MSLITPLLFACTQPTPVDNVPTEPSFALLDDLDYPTDPFDRARVRFQGEPPSLELEATDPDGFPVTFEVSIEPVGIEQVATWVPTEPLTPGTHVVTGILGVDVAPLTFEVQPWGADPSFRGLAPGDAFAFDPTAVVLEQPSGIGPVIQSQLEDLQIVIEVLDVDDDQLDLRFVAVEHDGACHIHTDTATVDAGGHLELRSSELPYVLAQDDGTVFDVALDLRLYDGAIQAGRLQARPELGPVGAVLVEGGDTSTVCDLAAQFGIDCGVCPDGGTTCLPIVVEDLVGEPWTPFWEPGADLNPCDADPDPLIDAPPPISCGGGGCSTSTGSTGWLAIWLGGALLLRRRHPSGRASTT